MARVPHPRQIPALYASSSGFESVCFSKCLVLGTQGGPGYASVLAHSPPELPVCQTRVQAGLCVARHKDSPMYLSFSQAGRVQVPLLSALHLPGGSWPLLAAATDAPHLNLPKGQCPGLWPGETRERGVDAKINTTAAGVMSETKALHCSLYTPTRSPCLSEDFWGGRMLVDAPEIHGTWAGSPWKPQVTS